MEPWNFRGREPQDFIRAAIQLCADCETCRDLIEQECRPFPAFFRLHDEQVRTGVPIPEEELRKIAEQCTYCGLCPCPEIPSWFAESKARYAEREGLPLAVRLLMDVPRMARACGTFPRIARTLLPPLLKKGGMHRDRQFPAFAGESFFKWAARNGLTERRGAGPHAMYFAGCTAGYLFPDVGRAVVKVLTRNGVSVRVPPQKCCGMPYLVEGDRANAVQKVRETVEQFAEAMRAGDDVVCSCPTCGFLLKVLLKEKAYYSDEYQQSVHAPKDQLWVPDPVTGEINIMLRAEFGNLCKDDGWFSSIPALTRIGVANHVRDMGQYLMRLRAEGRLDTGFSPIPGRFAYFAPCHQRQQKMGRPYLELLRLVPGMSVEQVCTTECCGMGGNFGFKDSYHDISLGIGKIVFDAIDRFAPDAIVTDCISCRLQFQHALRYPVFHPIEILARAYGGADAPAGTQRSR